MWGRMRHAVVVVVAFGVLVAACGGGTGGVDPSLPGDTLAGGQDLPASGDQSGGTVTVPTLVGDAGPSPAPGEDLCDSAPKPHSYLVEIGLLNEEDLAGLPVPYEFDTAGFWPTGPLGSDGAFGVGDEITDGPWICGLEPTPAVIAAVTALFEESEDVTAEEVLAVVQAAAESGQASQGTPEVGMSDTETRQRMRDLIAVAAVAQRIGETERGEGILDEAKALLSDYVGVKIFETENLDEILDLAGMAQVLGIDDVADLAIQRAVDITQKRLADAEELFSPCTTDQHIIDAYFHALGQALILDVHTNTSEGDAWRDIQERRATQVMEGEEPGIPECEGAIWISSQPLRNKGNTADKWEGTIDIVLETCGYSHWTGRMTVDGVLDTEGGTMTQRASVPLEFRVDPYSTTRREVRDSRTIQIEDVISLVAGDATGEGVADMAATAIFMMVGIGSEVDLQIAYNPATFTFTIHAGGVTMTRSQQIDWGLETFHGELTPQDGLCDPTR
ncbi:MAG: hypothetical protein MUQ27_05210 [Acidimicrobiia bacterium]|nr:hypothetical protein [Acidimicrobiia bacterium]